MRRSVLAAFSVLSIFVAPPARSQSGSAEFERAIAGALDSVYMLGVARRVAGGPEVFQLVGTGWVIAEGKLATNAHVAESLLETSMEGRLVAKRSWSDRDELALSASSIRIHPAYGPWNARLKRVVVRNENDPGAARSMNFIPIADVAIVEVEAGETATPLTLADPAQVEPVLSEAVVYLGFPHENISGFPTLHAVPGHVTAKTDFFFQRAPWRDSYLIHYCGPVVGGASGSPMLNRAGQVIGLISAAENNLSINGERTSFGFAYGQRADLALELLRDDFESVQSQRNSTWSQRLSNLLIPPDELLEQLALQQAASDGVLQLASANTVTRKQVTVKQSEPARLQVTLEPGLRYGFLAAAHDGSDVDAQLLVRESGESVAVDVQVDYFPCLWVGPVEQRVAVTFEIVASERLLGDTLCSVHVYKYEPQQVAPPAESTGLFFEHAYEHPAAGGAISTWRFQAQAGANLMFSGESADQLDIDLVLLADGAIVASDETPDSVPMVMYTTDKDCTLELRLRVPDGAAQGAQVQLKGLVLGGPAPLRTAGARGRDELFGMLDSLLNEVWKNAGVEGQTVAQDIAAIDGTLEVVFDVPADTVPVFVALAPDGEDLDLELIVDGQVIARVDEDGAPALAALEPAASARKVTMRLIEHVENARVSGVPYRFSTVRPN